MDDFKPFVEVEFVLFLILTVSTVIYGARSQFSNRFRELVGQVYLRSMSTLSMLISSSFLSHIEYIFGWIYLEWLWWSTMVLQCLSWSVLGLSPLFNAPSSSSPATGHCLPTLWSSLVLSCQNCHTFVLHASTSRTNISWVPPSWTLTLLCWAWASRRVSLCRKSSSALGKAFPAGRGVPGRPHHPFTQHLKCWGLFWALQ